MMITATSRKTKVGVSVRNVPAPGGATRLPDSEPATASAASSGRKRPTSIAPPPSRFANVIVTAPALPGALGWMKAV